MSSFLGFVSLAERDRPEPTRLLSRDLDSSEVNSEEKADEVDEEIS